MSQACLLLALNSQLENKPMQSSVLQRAEKVSSPRARAGGAASWPRSTRCTRRCSRRSSTSGSTISTSYEVVKSLARSLPSKGEAPYLLVHMHGTQLDQCRCHCSRMRASRACSAACKCSPRRLASFPTGALACVPRVPRAHSALAARERSSSFASKASLSSPSACATTTLTSRPPRCASYALLAAESAHARDGMRT